MTPRKKGEKMLTTAEITDRQKLKNTIEKTERENNSNGITENVFPNPLSLNNSKCEIMKEKQLKWPQNSRRARLCQGNLHCLLLNTKQQKLAL